MRGVSDNLEAFAKRIETRIRASIGETDAMERLICRVLTDKKNPALAATMAQRWVEWKYGKARETMKLEGTVTHEIFNFDKLTDEQLAKVEDIVESAVAERDSR